MAENSNDTVAKNGSAKSSNYVKHYADSAYVAKKTQKARETLQQFPVPEKYCK